MRLRVLAERYDRAAGALSCSVPALIFVIMSLLGGPASIDILIVLLLDFIPLVLLGYGLDMLFRLLPRRVREARGVSPWVPLRIILGWAIGFPIVRTLGNLGHGLLEGREIASILWGLLLDLPFLIVFGFFFGVFFTVAYSFFVRLRLYLARRKALAKRTAELPGKAREMREAMKRRKPYKRKRKA